ncbi:relaxase domain-containing protein [Seleniivibrio woodruffii]|uniref:relaxase domain-containing protein n=1 Tax=Seleniivibrio woodruffii TaxID=1078050 RepID=UPI002409AB66|nr:relaxase domain-containing protein [Seleniivibrio woodruffii]
MLSIARIGSDASNYYKTEDYYLADKGQWGGSLSDELSLKGEVQKDDLENTLAGFDRDGGKLVKSAGTDSHRSGIDLTFSAPKSVGIEMLNNPEVFKVQNAAVDGVMNYIESELAQTRTYSA